MTASLLAASALVLALIAREELRFAGVGQRWSRHYTVGIAVLVVVWLAAAAQRALTLFNQAV